MNLKEILDKYTKERLLENLFELYPEQKQSRNGYDYIIDKLKTLTVEETPIILHIDMEIVDGKDAYDIYGIDDQNERVNLSFLPWPVWISMEIEPGILEILDEQDVLCHCLTELSINGKTDGTISDMVLDIYEMFSEIFGVDVENIIPITGDEEIKLLEDFEDDFFKGFNIVDLGEINLESNSIYISDVNDIEESIAIENIKQGKWNVSIIDEEYEEEEKKDIPNFIELTLKHEDIKDQNLYSLIHPISMEICDYSLNTKSKKIIAIDESKFNELEIYSCENDSAKLLINGVIAPCGVDDSPFPIAVYRDKDDKIIGIRIIMIQEQIIELN